MASSNSRASNTVQAGLTPPNHLANTGQQDSKSDIGHADDICNLRTRLFQRVIDINEALVSLIFDLFAQAHGFLVVAGRAGNKYKVTFDNRTGIADLGFKIGAARN